MDYLRGLLGLIFIVGVAYLLSGNRKAIDWRLVLIGIVIQLAFGLIIGKVEVAQRVFIYVSEKFVVFLSFAAKGGEFLYGDLSKNSIGNPDVKHNLGFLFAFQALPTVIFFSAVTAGLYYLGVLQKLCLASPGLWHEPCGCQEQKVYLPQPIFLWAKPKRPYW